MSEVILFGVSKLKAENAFRIFMAVSEFSTFIANAPESLSKVYDFIAFKEHVSSNENKFSYSTEITKQVTKTKPNTYIFFADGLDLSSLAYLDKIELNGIKQLRETSINFSRFTACADWTFPVLHAIHSGIPTVKTLSYNRYDPIIDFYSKIPDENKIDLFSPNHRDAYVASLSSGYSRKQMLIKKLKNNGQKF